MILIKRSYAETRNGSIIENKKCLFKITTLPITLREKRGEDEFIPSILVITN